jgi:Uma2 family endonuclease
MSELAMSIVSPPEPKGMTAEEFLALPDDGNDRWLIRGCVFPRKPATSVRNRKHSRAATRLAQALANWLDDEPSPRGEIHTGDGGFRLKQNPDTLVGIDVAYVSAEVVAATGADDSYHNGPPVLAIEILSPSDTHEDIVTKIEAYLEAGSVVWIADPDLRHILVHHPGGKSEFFYVSQELSGEPYHPGSECVSHASSQTDP